ncbi:general stress protein [Porphyrobacter sp. GA68]|uniref:general stress protein n=1 Tax=Porphyrobacter sp. GA68 TaxID=2883480 RepID=UPI001D18F102|nr:general stress protein [Porphyrobacter sp. GA68]
MAVQSAIFDSQAEAQRAVGDLRAAGVGDDAISLVAHHNRTTTTTDADGHVTDEEHTSLVRGIFGGGALGAGLGVAALAIPGVGPLAAAGAIAASAVPAAMGTGAVLGAIGGSLNEVMKGHGVSDEDAAYYGDRMKSGAVFVSVDTDRTAVPSARIDDVLYSAGGHNSSRQRGAGATRATL